ncbi:addiction module antidote protein [Salimicrobium jeotgali]|uniref:Addiction module antidote n=1 Tax=Salimicrobium jeotgali TaxID=1230341 RepID=K2GDG0_9BACI|nr:addiction module antidote protein [Salimicrobium jeotgali]AKG05290.1 addiction module antidote protein [Salimicrobium jeotgali]EKE32317.1 addiction module antidote [Salimicrobium jeotgali]MBM7695711.1 putative addiction module antidote [Salimicrobium jeotgali]
MSVKKIDKKNYTRKVSQVGNSLSLNLPKELTDLLEITKGEELQITYNEDEGEIVVKKANWVPEGIRPEMLKAMNRAVGKYDQALRNLKDR